MSTSRRFCEGYASGGVEGGGGGGAQPDPNRKQMVPSFRII